ncbi:phosphotransferase enzyme family protein [Lederbergia citrea]|uniref:phosphotransferase enzyme family protein n=1 Tax=Lederbergia citrea TaxID=2833581 RepID=UPI003211C617
MTFFEHTGGEPVDVMNSSEWNGEFFYRWGRMIASLHSVDDPPFSGPKGCERQVQTNEEWLKDRYNQLCAKLNSHERTEQNFGLIHNDLHQGNFHIKNGEIILFDFDDCAYQYFVQDLAVSIYHALWTGTSFHSEWEDFPNYFLFHFLEGYTSLRHLTGDMLDQLKICMQMREVILYSLFQENWNPESMDDWQFAKLAELRENLLEKRIPYSTELDGVKNFFNH